MQHSMEMKRSIRTQGALWAFLSAQVPQHMFQNLASTHVTQPPTLPSPFLGGSSARSLKLGVSRPSGPRASGPRVPPVYVASPTPEYQRRHYLPDQVEDAEQREQARVKERQQGLELKGMVWGAPYEMARLPVGEPLAPCALPMNLSAWACDGTACVRVTNRSVQHSSRSRGVLQREECCNVRAPELRVSMPASWEVLGLSHGDLQSAVRGLVCWDLSRLETGILLVCITHDQLFTLALPCAIGRFGGHHDHGQTQPTPHTALWLPTPHTAPWLSALGSK